MRTLRTTCKHCFGLLGFEGNKLDFYIDDVSYHDVGGINTVFASEVDVSVASLEGHIHVVIDAFTPPQGGSVVLLATPVVYLIVY